MCSYDGYTILVIAQLLNSESFGPLHIRTRNRSSLCQLVLLTVVGHLAKCKDEHNIFFEFHWL